MNNKNIIFNMTIEQYNKRYRNRKGHLLKFSKKDVSNFGDKNNVDNKFFLNGRKWALIGDTYCEIPKFPRITWFRNLNACVQASVCLLGAGIVATAVTVPTVLLNKGENVRTIDKNKFIELYNKYKEDYQNTDKVYSEKEITHMKGVNEDGVPFDEDIQDIFTLSLGEDGLHTYAFGKSETPVILDGDIFFNMELSDVFKENGSYVCSDKYIQYSNDSASNEEIKFFKLNSDFIINKMEGFGGYKVETTIVDEPKSISDAIDIKLSSLTSSSGEKTYMNLNFLKLKKGNTYTFKICPTVEYPITMLVIISEIDFVDTTSLKATIDGSPIECTGAYSAKTGAIILGPAPEYAKVDHGTVLISFTAKEDVSKKDAVLIFGM